MNNPDDMSNLQLTNCPVHNNHRTTTEDFGIDNESSIISWSCGCCAAVDWQWNRGWIRATYHTSYQSAKQHALAIVADNRDKERGG